MNPNLHLILFIISKCKFWFASVLAFLLQSDSLGDIMFFFRNRNSFCAVFGEKRKNTLILLKRHKWGFFLVYVKGRCYYWCFPYLSIQLMFFPCNLFSLIYLWSYYFFPKNKWLKFCSSLQAKPVTVNEFCLVQKSFIKCSSSITKQCGSSIWGFLYPLLYSSDLKSHFALWFKLCRRAWKL